MVCVTHILGICCIDILVISQVTKVQLLTAHDSFLCFPSALLSVCVWTNTLFFLNSYHSASRGWAPSLFFPCRAWQKCHLFLRQLQGGQIIEHTGQSFVGVFSQCGHGVSGRVSSCRGQVSQPSLVSLMFLFCIGTCWVCWVLLASFWSTLKGKWVYFCLRGRAKAKCFQFLLCPCPRIGTNGAC